MKPDLLEVQPQELKFIYELKKQSSCSVQMINKTNHHVAFKIKTTNPKKYCVRPNAGVIDPNGLCDFSVTMQAPKVAPPDMICRDKFLVQSTIVSEGTKEEDVTSSMFAKEDGKTVDEKRLKVILLSPPDSSESSPIDGPLDLVDSNESRELKDDIGQQSSSRAMVVESMEVPKGDGESVEVTRKEESFKRKEAVKRIEEPVKPSQEYAKRNEEFLQINDTEELTLAKDVEELNSKLKELESKLTEAKATILHLTEEKRSVTQEKHFLQGELDLVRSKRHRGQTGFPSLFVFMVGLVSLYLGYLLHS
ncbi:hypothetical protein L1987_78781 [Smallanthus sonchifolius]|uniref:Uncharacterized protein n=1 Tax=Smallanthus sonchifolius TaxID=185202 RepID=A0ACB8ZDG7_9ASTR|nr:hypothetical protein L1987_78781 [Smallanthus sonchifolius]